MILCAKLGGQISYMEPAADRRLETRGSTRNQLGGLHHRYERVAA